MISQMGRGWWCVTLSAPFGDNRGMKAVEAVPAGEQIGSVMHEADFEAWMAREQRRVFALGTLFNPSQLQSVKTQGYMPPDTVVEIKPTHPAGGTVVREWLLWDIPATIHNLPEQLSVVGTLGSNSVNSKGGYAPPCSQSPGLKTYTFAAYALSAAPQLSGPAISVTRDALLKAISDRTLASATLNVTYARP